MLQFHHWVTGHPYNPPYIVALTTLERVKSDTIVTSKTDDDALLKRLILAASMIFVGECRRTFVPFQATRVFDWQNPTRLRLSEDLLEMTSISDRSGVIDSGDYVVIPSGSGPIAMVQLILGKKFDHGSQYEQAITISGTWGYHPSPSTMFQQVSTLTQAVSATGQTSLQIYTTPSILTYSYIKIGTELMRVESISKTSTIDTLTVTREDLGSVASTYPQGLAVYAYTVPEDIQVAVTLLAGYLYETRDNFGSSYATVEGAIEVAKLAPELIDATAMKYRAKR